MKMVRQIFFLANPEEKELPILFIILKFYEYILVLIGVILVIYFKVY